MVSCLATVPYKQQKLYRQIILLLATREAGLTPHEPSIGYDVYALA